MSTMMATVVVGNILAYLGIIIFIINCENWLIIINNIPWMVYKTIVNY